MKYCKCDICGEAYKCEAVTRSYRTIMVQKVVKVRLELCDVQAANAKRFPMFTDIDICDDCLSMVIMGDNRT